MFKVYKATSLEEALKILERKKESCKVIAGGTDLIIDIKNNKFNKSSLVDISDIEELKFINHDKNKVKIGVCTTFDEIIESKALDDSLKDFKKAAASVGSPQIRNRGTIGGNICNNSPSADIIPPLLVLDAIVCTRSKNYTRKVYLKDILLDKNKVDLYSSEIIEYVSFNSLKENQALGFSKLGIRNSLSIAKVSCAVLVEVEDDKFKNINIALGAMDKIARREYYIENYLTGKVVNKENIEISLNILESLISERLKGRKSKDFKSKAVKGVLKEAINNCIEKLQIKL